MDLKEIIDRSSKESRLARDLEQSGSEERRKELESEICEAEKKLYSYYYDGFSEEDKALIDRGAMYVPYGDAKWKDHWVFVSVPEYETHHDSMSVVLQKKDGDESSGISAKVSFLGPNRPLSVRFSTGTGHGGSYVYYRAERVHPFDYYGSNGGELASVEEAEDWLETLNVVLEAAQDRDLN